MSQFYASTSSAVSKLDERPLIIGTHYFGFGEYDWAPGFLSTIDAERAVDDLKIVKDMGFNTIILVASWGDFEPVIGDIKLETFDKLEKIILAAEKNNLKVHIRAPYFWNLSQKDPVDLRQIQLFLNHNQWNEWITFLKIFRDRILTLQNVEGVFGSWEDFLIVEEEFFHESEKSALLRMRFEKDTGLDPNEVKRYGENYDTYLSWQNKIVMGFRDQLTEIFGEYSFEVRVDSDPQHIGEKSVWLDHSVTYAMPKGSTIVYWAPYYGAKNQGDAITGKTAAESFKWMLGNVKKVVGDEKHIWVDQLNIVDNTYGTEQNSHISSDEMGEFLERIAPTIASETGGYALWTLKEYVHNILADPKFLEPLNKYWRSRKAAKEESGYIQIKPGGYIEQNVSPIRLGLLASKKTKVDIDIVEGVATLGVSGKKIIDIAANKPVPVIDTHLIGGGAIRLENTGDKDLILKKFSLVGHHQSGKVLGLETERMRHFDDIVNFNGMLQDLSGKACYKYSTKIAESVYVSGVYEDGWFSEKIKLCIDSEQEDPIKLVLTLNNLIGGNVFTLKNGITEVKFSPSEGIADVELCFNPKLNNTIQISTSKQIVPAEEFENNQDMRSLSANLYDARLIKCN